MSSLQEAASFEGGKYRIYNHFQQKKAENETVAFLKKEYGIGGFSWTFADGGSGFVNFDGKGLSILYDFKDDLRYEKKLKWKEVGKRLEYLVRMDRYLTDAEREKMPAWINRQAESKPLLPPMPISSVMMKESCFHYHRTAYMVQRISSQVRF